jgi:sodium/proline symporter
MVAVLAAVMSTASSYIFTTAAAIVRDLAVKTFGVKLNDKNQLLWIRMAMIVAAVITVALSLKPPALIGLVGAQAFATFCAGFGPVMYLAFRWKRVTSKAAVAGMATGLLLGGAFPIINNIFFNGEILYGWTIGGLAAAAAWVITIVVTLATKPEPALVFDKNYKVPDSDVA